MIPKTKSKKGKHSSEGNGKLPLTDTTVVRKRRDEIISAATEIIASEGIHRLSLGRIESRVQMSRGQLTYYFHTKESILLAVFDRMLTRMIEESIAEAKRDGVELVGRGSALDRVNYGMTRMMADVGTDRNQLMSLVNTFLAQIQHRDDFREKLSEADTNLRNHVAGDVAVTAQASTVPPEIVASIIMALFQGLRNQLAVNPEAFDRPAMVLACLRMLAPLLGVTVSEESR